ncbi:MOSC domain-containing protein [uncultured Sphingomonas sp.]|uniref:MOSC domain-containing protein n=1 Tax=uncultured Sphingomonas sp. TaxID=158754 RepID=UPI0035CA3865
MSIGVVGGIARHAYVKAPVEVIASAEVSCAGGIAGDHRGVRKPGTAGKRQVTLIERSAWDAAMAEVGRDLPWWERRCNLLVDGLELPRTPGSLLRLGRDVVLEVTRETDPCERMELLAPGLFAALARDWRGGICARVIAGGNLDVGDVIRTQEP